MFPILTGVRKQVVWAGGRLLAGLCLLAGCSSTMPAPTLVNVRLPLPPTPTALATHTPLSAQAARAGSLYTPAALPGGLVDALPVMSGVCFEAAYDAAGQVFVLRTAEDQMRLYDQLDRSGRCRQPVGRYSFDFSTGAALVGLWSQGAGCTAQHDLAAYERDAAARRLTLQVRFSTQGDCPYELVRPFWLGVPGAGDYDITLTVVP